MKHFNAVRKFGAVVVLAAVTSPVFAAVDTTGIISELGDAGKAVAVVGGAVLSVIIGIKVFKFIQRAMG
ncbi:major capsid protein [Iodobacter sp. CM08]|uniref:major capsid protein n=1 Tax=Iodobacter sp. CM08 TaxID=3085902 RepID=UPI0029826535|nr:major capsid protein [Iodobacter sp. CM08]MDW5418875.1 major capsid protein [Iodobacter sp. CM08]